MNKLPRVVWDQARLLHNAAFLDALCNKHEYSISWTPVTKVVCADPDIIQALLNKGYHALADSRIENLKSIKKISPNCQTTLLRLPGLHEIAEVIRYADVSLVSEIETIKKLQEMAQDVGVIHKIILMIELGDLREGILAEHLSDIGRLILAQSNIEWLGIGTNLTCYGGVIPTREIMMELLATKQQVEKELGHSLSIISGGNSSILPLLMERQIPEGVNQLRLGEALFFGKETAYGGKIPGMYDDIFTLQAEVIEVKEKNSIPRGPVGMNAFGEKPVFIDKGRHRRAIVALGEQDVPAADLSPLDPSIEIIGGSSDHLILDVSGSDTRVGDVLSFRLNYRSLLYAMTSKYVGKSRVAEELQVTS
ncbi:alanine/ornithine racemase family PLP-dependent enzyme [Zobellella maritima]|uniref:alanine/ornithine racemase family PLP-dependent enzyme n=1 Tax=Zobellella maritima TaxID=2059725 RepID=UPI000E30537A|nr:alanine/ornithine racemase family PLP-dependent enzyme [Zobellella maritima]